MTVSNPKTLALESFAFDFSMTQLRSYSIVKFSRRLHVVIREKDFRCLGSSSFLKFAFGLSALFSASQRQRGFGGGPLRYGNIKDVPKWNKLEFSQKCME
jgi:hypothetical protein